MGRASLVVAIVTLCAACTALRGRDRPAPLSVALGPLDPRGPIPLLVWTSAPIEALGFRRHLLLAAYDDGRIIFRTPKDGDYRIVTDTALVRRLYGSAAERAAYAALRDVRMPPEWRVFDGATESVCLWTGDEMRCHHPHTPMGEHVGRPEACTRYARDTTSYSGRQAWTTCRERNALHAALPTPFAMYYRRIYDAVQERADAATPWTPGRVILTVREAGCAGSVRTPWPEGVPRPRGGERAGKTEWGEVRHLAMTVEQERRLREVDHASFTDCLVADGSVWAWWAYFELPNLGVAWDWEG